MYIYVCVLYTSFLCAQIQPNEPKLIWQHFTQQENRPIDMAKPTRAFHGEEVEHP